ncbi:MAG: DNA glycosylase AlkZ-like family protein, partial [Anaerolineales bacterium]
MKKNELAKIRLNSQQIVGSKFTCAMDVLDWMGAIQAQDFGMAKWAIGIRLPHSNDDGIRAAIDKGEILRTHLLRPTWHFVSKDNIYWILELTTQQIKGSFKSRHIQLGLTNTILRKSNTIMEKALKGGNHLTREELI